MRGFLLALLALLAPTALAAKEPARPAAHYPQTATTWAFEESDVPVDADFRFGRLDNGMRYIIRHNATPQGTGVVRMDVATGSLDEADSEQGFAHFLEHMAFNGSKRVPEGQMIPLLERDGLAFGADTNASTGFERTIYKLDLPRDDAALLDTALMLMRETASELTIAEDAVSRERGVILSEMRDRNTWAFRNAVDSAKFFYPLARYSQRFPIGTRETLEGANGQNLRAFYEREYVPAHVTLVIVGDYDVAAVEAAIVRHFNDWQPAPVEPQPDAGPVSRKDKGRTEIHIDPSLSERITVLRNDAWLGEPDSIAQRQENLLRSIGYDIVNRRLQRLSRMAMPPFRGAGFGTGDVFEAARSTRLIIDSVDGNWREGLLATAAQYRRALANGFTKAEVAEQVAGLRAQITNAAGSADTRSNAALAEAALALVQDRQVPSSPRSVLERFEAFAPTITPEAVLAAVRREAVPLKSPLIRFEGRKAPDGGAKALRAAWREAMKAPITKETDGTAQGFAYGDFGIPGTIVSDAIEPALGIREIRFANGAMLNLKRTDIEKNKVRLTLAIDGGDKLATRANPLATEMAPYLDQGGLGKHSRDDLDTIFAGHTVGLNFQRGTATFDSVVQTTPVDLPLQLELLTALIVDPGYRPEGEVQYRQAVANYFARKDGTPASALQAALGGILSDDDPRFSLQTLPDYQTLSYAKLREDISDRLAHGAIEIGIVGDIDDDTAIALVARTLGALPPRESAFRSYDDQPTRTFTADRSRRVIHHDGPADQALLRLTWPTRDDSDPLESLQLELLERIVRVELTDELREALGKAYSPSASSSLSRHWKGYGLFSINASVDVAEVPATRGAIDRVLASLRDAPVSADILQRARQPMIEQLQNALKSNQGWLSLVDRAQSEAERIERYTLAKARLEAITPQQVQAEAKRYLAPEAGLEVLVLPKGIEAPK